MRISFSNFNINNTLKQYCVRPNYGKESIQDSTPKLSNVSFSSIKGYFNIFDSNSIKISSENDFESFIKWAEKTNFIKKIRRIVKRERDILGSGFEGVVYNIPNCEKWVLKEFKHANIFPKSIQEPTITEIQDISPKLNIGQIIAKVEIPRGKSNTFVYYILKKQVGDSLGVSIEDSCDISSKTISKHIESLQKIANMPQLSYDKLISDVNYIYNLNYQIDCGNSNNLMYDSEKNEINFVDITDERKTDCNQYGDLLFCLLGAFYMLRFQSDKNVSSADRSKVEKLNNQIIKKYFNSMKKANKFFDFTVDFNLLLKTTVLDNVLDSFD